MRRIGLVLFWNPETSHYSMDSFEKDLWKIFSGYDIEPLCWGTNNMDDIEQGTDFAVVKIGDGNCGVVMSGYLLTEHKYDESHKRYCRKHYRTDSEVVLAVMEMYHPDRSKIITLDNLKEALPHLPFDGSVNELLLCKSDSQTLGNIYARFLSTNKDIFEPRAGRRPILPLP